MAKPVPSRRRQTLATSTLETVDALAGLNAALQNARAKYRALFLSKRPPGGFTMQEFTDNYNAHSTQKNFPTVSKRAAEAMFKKWVQAGDYQRAPMMLAGPDGVARRTYVYWEAK